MRNLLLSLTLISASAFAQSSSVKVWDGTRTSSVRDTGSSDSLNVAIVDASGNQITSFGGAGGTSSNFTAAFPAAGTAIGYSDGTNMQGARVFDTDSGAGTQYTLGCSLRGSGSGGSVEIGTSANPVRTDPTGTTAQPVTGTFWQATQPVSGTVTCNAGTGPFPVSDNGGSLTVDNGGTFAVQAAQSGTWNINNVSGTVSLPTGAATEATLSTLNGKVTACNTGAVTVSAALPAGNNNIGDVDAIQSGTWTVQPGNTANTTPWLVSDNAITTGGYTPYSFGALVGTVQTVKGAAGTLGGWDILNAAATVCYLQFFDTAGAVTLGTTAPTWSKGIPAGSSANVGPTRPGIAFANGLKIAATTTRDGSTPCGTGMDVNLFYK